MTRARDDLQDQVRRTLLDMRAEPLQPLEPSPALLRRAQRASVVTVIATVAAAALVVLGTFVGVRVLWLGRSEQQMPVGRSSGPAPSGVVPWANRSAPPYRESPSPSPAGSIGPMCRASDVRASAGRSGVGMGNTNLRVSMRNVSSSPCELRGFPADLLGVTPGGRIVRLHPGHGSYFGDPGPVVPAPPGMVIAINISGSDMCSQHLVFATLRLVLPSGQNVDVDGRRFDAGCGVSVSRFGVPSLVTRSVVSPLRIEVAAPPQALAGSLLRYRVTIANAGSRAFLLTPCPSYEETLWVVGAGPKTTTVHGDYYLNCDGVRAIEAHRSVTFAMVVAVPRTTGEAKLDWQLHVPGILSGGSAVQVVERQG